MISKSRRDSVGGGSSRIVPCSPKADSRFSGGGGGAVAEFFPACSPGPDHIPLSSVAKSHFYPTSSGIRG